jgi:hypothetical protein
LLGELDEDSSRVLEERYFADDKFFELLLEVEDRLIQEDAAGRLSREYSERFETHFLTSSVRRQKVEAAKTVARCGESTDELP